MSSKMLFSLPFEEVLRRTSGRTPDAGAGTVCAMACASAASLVAMAARFAGEVAVPVLTGAEDSLTELGRLPEADAEGFAELLQARNLPKHDPERAERITAGALRACQVPLRICEIGAGLVDHAAWLATEGKADLRGDALTAAYLADAAVASAARLVAMNLSQVDEQAPADEARSYAARTRTVVERM